MKQSKLRMVRASFPKAITQPMRGLTLLGVMATTWTSSLLAQMPTVAAPVAAPSPVRLAQASGTYTLGGGDNIRVDIFDLPQLSGEYQIPAGGTIQLPLIGSISVQGLTLQEATNNISAAYAPILKRPLITVSLLATRPLNIWISGEVNRPGSYAIALASGGGNRPSVQFPTLVQAIQQAGGATQAADIRSVQLRRRSGLGPEEVMTFDLWQFLQTGAVLQDITLRDGDTIFIPTANNVNLREARQLADASFATSIDQPRTVAVLGEVTRPGSYVVLGGQTTNESRTVGQPSVTRALQLAGGIKPMADIRRVQIRRPTRNGTEQIFNVNLWQLLQTGDFMQDTIVQDGDTIIVPTATEVNPAEVAELAESSFSTPRIQVNVVGEVRSPGAVQVPSNTTLNQALLAAGGVNPDRANRKAVELIRLNDDGTVSRRTLAIDLAQSINAQTNPLMRNNDIIVVRRSGAVSLADDVNTALTPVSNILALVTIPIRMVELLDALGIIGR